MPTTREMKCAHTDATKEAAYRYNGQCPVCQAASIRELEAALRDMLATHGIHGPCRHHSCRDCEAAYRKAKQLLSELPPKE